MPNASARTPGSQDLSTFQTVVQQQEGVYGPLKALASQGPDNVMTFSVGTSPDAAHRAVLETYSGSPPSNPGYILICSGKCLVSGAAQQVAAYRKRP